MKRYIAPQFTNQAVIRSVRLSTYALFVSVKGAKYQVVSSPREQVLGNKYQACGPKVLLNPLDSFLNDKQCPQKVPGNHMQAMHQWASCA